jgi:hypothetical protein
MDVTNGMIFGLVLMVGLGIVIALATLAFGTATLGRPDRKIVLIILATPIYMFMIWGVVALALLASGRWK